LTLRRLLAQSSRGSTALGSPRSRANQHSQMPSASIPTNLQLARNRTDTRTSNPFQCLLAIRGHSGRKDERSHGPLRPVVPLALSDSPARSFTPTRLQRRCSPMSPSSISRRMSTQRDGPLLSVPSRPPSTASTQQASPLPVVPFTWAELGAVGTSPLPDSRQARRGSSGNRPRHACTASRSMSNGPPSRARRLPHGRQERHSSEPRSSGNLHSSPSFRTETAPRIDGANAWTSETFGSVIGLRLFYSIAVQE
jgi:hypothetical protein